MTGNVDKLRSDISTALNKAISAGVGPEVILGMLTTFAKVLELKLAGQYTIVPVQDDEKKEGRE